MSLGYGLVSEECPAQSVGCRIKVEHHAIEFYEYSALYDRNQLACVFRNEYGAMQNSGCAQRRAGECGGGCIKIKFAAKYSFALRAYEHCLG